MRTQVLSALSKAEVEAKPSIEELFNDVYAELTPNLKEQREELRQHLAANQDQYSEVMKSFDGNFLKNNNCS